MERALEIFWVEKEKKEKAFRLLDSRRELEALPVHPSLRTRQAKQQKEHHDVQPPRPLALPVAVFFKPEK